METALGGLFSGFRHPQTLFGMPTEPDNHTPLPICFYMKYSYVRKGDTPPWYDFLWVSEECPRLVGRRNVPDRYGSGGRRNNERKGLCGMNIQKAKVTSKGQLTLPKSIRDRLNLEKGSYIAIYLEKDQLVMKKVNPKKPLSDADPIWDLVGMFHDGCEGQETPRENRVENKVTPFREASKWKQS